MNTQALIKVRKLFCIPGVPTHIQRHNCRQWIKSVRQLGDRWLVRKAQDKAVLMEQAAGRMV